MGKLPEIRLVIFDADDTLWHAYIPWARCMEPALRDYVEVLGVDPEVLRHVVQQRATGQHRFNCFSGLTHFLKHTEDLFPPSDDKEANDNRDIIRKKIRNRFILDWNDLTRFHNGVVDTLTRHIKPSGTATAVWTDADAPSAIRRCYYSSVNAGLDPRVDTSRALSMIDAWYVMPSIECDSHSLWGVDDVFIRDIKTKMNVARVKQGKPYLERGRAIMEDFGVTPEQTLMIGDNTVDLQSALESGMHAAWFQPGVSYDEKTLAMLNRYASPKYNYGLENVKSTIEDFAQGRSYITVFESMAELAQHFTFAPAESVYRHSPSSLRLHIPLATATKDQMGTRLRPELYGLFGIATHLPSESPAIVPQDPAGKAGPERPDPLQANQPVSAIV